MTNLRLDHLTHLAPIHKLLCHVSKTLILALIHIPAAPLESTCLSGKLAGPESHAVIISSQS